MDRLKIIDAFLKLLLLRAYAAVIGYMDYRREISFSDSRFIRAEKYVNNQSWNGFVYGLCTYVEGKSEDVKCRLVIEKPTDDDEADIKSCKIGYSRKKELKRHNLRVDGFNLDRARLRYLEKNRLALEMPINGAHAHQSGSTFVTFVNMNTCKTINRYYTAENDKEKISIKFLKNHVKVMRYESKMCGSLRNCTIDVDFKGNEKSPVYNPLKLVNHDEVDRKKVSNPLIVTSNSNELYGRCRKVADDYSSNFNSTEYACYQKDNKHNLKFNSTFLDGRISIMTNVYNLPKGGLLVFTTDCDDYKKRKCDRFYIYKIDRDGLNAGVEVIKGMQPHREMEFLSINDEFCMFAMYARPPSTRKIKDVVAIHGKCIRLDHFKIE